MSRELKYWEQTGLALGTARYFRYMELFGLTQRSLVGQVVCDYGCGPLGGMLNVFEDVQIGYPVDILAATYNDWARCPWPILGVSNGRCPQIPGASCDAVFCLNVLDHVRTPRIFVRELARITKASGRLYLFVHLRRATKGHYAMTPQDVARYFTGDGRGLPWHPWEPQWKRVRLESGVDVPNNEPTLRALWSVMERR